MAHAPIDKLNLQLIQPCKMNCGLCLVIFNAVENEIAKLIRVITRTEISGLLRSKATSESKIYNILNRLQKNTDWNTLVTAYGTRKLSSGAGNIFVKDFNGNLPDSLRNELDNSEIKAVNQILSKIGVSI